MEFKDCKTEKNCDKKIVDIETEWNLKTTWQDKKKVQKKVDIETEWNLKWFVASDICKSLE